MSNVDRFKVCLKCNECILILSDINFYEFEKSFDEHHRNHLMVIMTTEEMFLYAEKQHIMKKIRKNDKVLKNLRDYADILTNAEEKYLNRIENENAELKNQLKQIQNKIYEEG